MRDSYPDDGFSSKTSSRPQRPQINKFIIALFLVKSKPATIPVRDYLSHLHAFVRAGERAASDLTGRRYIDMVECWKDSYQKSEAVQKELRAKISELVQRLERTSASTTKIASRLKSQAKRKRNGNGGDPVEASNDRARKVAKTVDGKPDLELEGLDLEAMALDLQHSGSWASHLLRDSYVLQRNSRLGDGPPEQIANRLMQICLDIRGLIANVETSMLPSTVAKANSRHSATRVQERTIAHEQTTAEEELETNITIVARIFPILLDAVDKLNRTAEGRKLSGQLVYHIVSVLRDILDRSCLLCGTEGREKHAVAQRTKKPPCRAEKEIADYLAAPNKHPKAGKGRGSAKTLYQLIIVMTTALDLSREADRAILDGFQFFILTRVGNLLRDFVFCDKEKENTDPHPRPNYKQAAAIREAQAPYLLRLLKHTTVLNSKMQISSTPTRRSSNRITSLRKKSSQSGEKSFSSKARTKLQNTLLRGVFGDDVTGLGESLAKPFDFAVGPLSLAERKDEPDDVGDWFKDEVWKTVGWDVLKDVIAWG